MSAPNLFVDDPMLPLKEAGEYIGCRGSDPAKTLRRLNIELDPMPGTGNKRPRVGCRRSKLNAYLESLKDPKSRTPKVRSTER